MRVRDLFSRHKKKPEVVEVPKEAPEEVLKMPLEAIAEVAEAPEAVFCSRCRFLEMVSAAEGGGWLCKAAGVEYRDDWFESAPFKALPDAKNANNDCPDYKGKRA